MCNKENVKEWYDTRKLRKEWYDIQENYDSETDFPKIIPQSRNSNEREQPTDYFHQYYDGFFFKLVAENASIHFQQTCNKLLGASDTEGWHC